MKKEHREQIGGEAGRILAQCGLDHAVVYEHQESLYRSEALAGSLVGIALVIIGHPQHQTAHEQDGDEEGTYVLGDGEVEGLVFLAVDNLHNLALVVAVLAGDLECRLAVAVFLAVVDARRGEHVQAALAVPYDDGQREALVVVEGHFPAVAVAEVVKDNLLGVDFLFLCLDGLLVPGGNLRRCHRGGWRGQHRQGDD